MSHKETDILLVGGGIMSATLGTLLNRLDPTLRITMVEQLPEVALESSDALNNAGTGHAGYCELNYTPQAADGSVEIKRALDINANYEVSLQFWASLVELGSLPSSNQFIYKTPHLSFVWGAQNVSFLKQRHQQLSQHHLFADMQYSEDFNQLKQWMPLVMADRSKSDVIAATYVDYGSDVNFGALTRAFVTSLQKQSSFTLQTNTKITNIERASHNQSAWHISTQSSSNKELKTISAKFVFLGAGGGALPLLQKAKVPESEGYGGFPVSGQWLICNDEAIVKQHDAKVYGKAALGAPPMSVPHLDTRMIDGKRALLFGPYAGFTTKFLKQGSTLDLLKSVKPNNIKSMLGVGMHNLDLTKYLVKEAKQSHEDRMQTLRAYIPDAKSADWQLAQAGQRVQIIKQCRENWGKLEFGTEIVSTEDGSLAALLGASPGASVSVKAMIDVLDKCFPDQMQSEAWQTSLKALIPSYGQSLIADAALLNKVRKKANEVLGLD